MSADRIDGNLLALSDGELELQARARSFVEAVLMPLEVDAELALGKISAERIAGIRERASAAGLSGGKHRVEHGGQGWSTVEWFLVEEQYGRCTGDLAAHIPGAYNVLAAGSPQQIERYLKPALQGEIHDAYAVTEADAGSDPSAIKTTARRSADGYVIDGEKWFVTFGDIASVYIVMANLGSDTSAYNPTLFLIDADAPGVEIIDNPPFTHYHPEGHPTIRFSGVQVGPEAVIGGEGQGDVLQQRWFTAERLGIAARCCGAMWRLIDEGMEWACGREQGGARLIDHQGVSFPLADSAADAAAARLLAFQVARLSDSGASPKLVHGKASMAKLFTSEAAWRCADRVVQTFGGRGYMRTNIAERFLRELRVDRIWEGTSEIQRLIIARSLERRGVEAMLH
jgi:acyl-CoA dehydrogenase